jgi:hypothetical protein
VGPRKLPVFAEVQYCIDADLTPLVGGRVKNNADLIYGSSPVVFKSIKIF